MNFRKINKFTFALILALGFVGAPGLSSLFTVQAQEPRHQEMRREQLERRVIMEERSAFRMGFRRGWARCSQRLAPQSLEAPGISNGRSPTTQRLPHGLRPRLPSGAFSVKSSIETEKRRPKKPPM